MTIRIGRRQLLTALGGAAVAWPFAARAQQQTMPVIGFLDSGSPDGMTATLDGFRRGLGEAGFTEGENLIIEYRWALGHIDRLSSLAVDLVRQQVAVIAASRSSAPALAAKAATTTIPIVFQTGGDPVKDGLVASLNQPGSNVTGATRLSTELMSKRLGMLGVSVPKATVISFLLNSTNLAAQSQIRALREAADIREQRLHVRNVGSERELEAAFATMAQDGTGALIIANDQLFMSLRAQLAGLAARYAIPAISSDRESVTEGGLMSYDASYWDSFRQVGAYVGRIIKGEKPADLPVLQPTKFELVINLITAKTLGVTIPSGMLSIADEVIE
jgi:putative ABC transport system substrate-binding protein